MTSHRRHSAQVAAGQGGRLHDPGAREGNRKWPTMGNGCAGGVSWALCLGPGFCCLTQCARDPSCMSTSVYVCGSSRQCPSHRHTIQPASPTRALSFHLSRPRPLSPLSHDHSRHYATSECQLCTQDLAGTLTLT